MKSWWELIHSNISIKEQIEKALQAEELAYPINLLSVSLRNFKLKELGVELHYWQMIQIHELLSDSNVFPENYDYATWYRYISAYLLLPKVELLTKINSNTWNSKTETQNVIIIEKALNKSLNSLCSSTLFNKKIAEQTPRENSNLSARNEIHRFLNISELDYPISLLEVNLRRLEAKAHYWNIMEIHEKLKTELVLPYEYSHNLWYKYIAAYIIINHVGVDQFLLIGLDKKSYKYKKHEWSDEIKREIEYLIRTADILVFP